MRNTALRKFLVGWMILGVSGVIYTPPLLAQKTKEGASEGLHSNDVAVRERALESLLASQACDRRLLPELVPLLEDSSAKVRAKAVQCLGQVGDPSASPAIAKLARDTTPDVRLAVAQSLRQLRATDRAEEMIFLARDTEEDVAIEAIRALEQFREVTAVKTLTEVAVNGESYRLRSAAIRALGNIPSQDCVPKLVVLLEIERDIWLRRELAWTLSRLNDERALKPLMQTLAQIRRETNLQTDPRRKEVFNETAAEFERAIVQLKQNIGKPPAQGTVTPPSPTPLPAANLEPVAPESTPWEEEANQPSVVETPTLSEEQQPPPPAQSPPPRQPRKQGKPTSPVEKPGMVYTVQVKATQDALLAEQVAQKLRAAGEIPVILTFEKDGEKWQRVRVGRFQSRQEAQAYGSHLQKSGLIDEFFVTR